MPSRSTFMRTLVPIRSRPIALRRVLASRTGLPSISITISPTLSPALSAAEPLSTWVMTAPRPCLRSKARASSGVRSWAWAPSRPRLTSPWAINWPIISCAILIGMAKPIPMLPPLWEKIAVLMPTSSPLRLTSAPPELPGLIEASVWMKSS